MALSKDYFLCGWNIFDLIIVSASLLDIIFELVDGLSVLRGLRLVSFNYGSPNGNPDCMHPIRFHSITCSYVSWNWPNPGLQWRCCSASSYPPLGRWVIWRWSWSLLSIFSPSSGCNYSPRTMSRRNSFLTPCRGKSCISQQVVAMSIEWWMCIRNIFMFNGFLCIPPIQFQVEF